MKKNKPVKLLIPELLKNELDIYLNTNRPKFKYDKTKRYICMKAYTCTCILNIMFEQAKYWNLLLYKHNNS